MNRGPVAEGEWYHCYNRGVDKRVIFSDSCDYDRFVMLVYLANSTTPLRASDIGKSGQGPTLEKVFEIERGEPLVHIAAYSLMPNHFHILAKPVVLNGLSQFMQKIATGYTMYFNKRHERTGVLLQGKYKSKHVDSDQYFRRVFNYIHANAAELYEPRWKSGQVKDVKQLENRLLKYPYSSFSAYAARVDSPVINKFSAKDLFERMPTFNNLLEEAQIFAHQFNQSKVGP